MSSFCFISVSDEEIFIVTQDICDNLGDEINVEIEQRVRQL
jgi:hypothetical protein